MGSAAEAAALVALLRLGRRPDQAWAELVEGDGSALAILEHEVAHPGGQASLLPENRGALLEHAAAEIAGWQALGFGLTTVLDPTYPRNLREVHDRPALLFVAGELRDEDVRAIAVIGSRRASGAGLRAATELAGALTRAGWVVVSGLASGIDTAAHTATLKAGGRTIAVIGTGLTRCYPPENADLQARIGRQGAVVSQFWPDAPPSRQSFPLRNAVMSGLARATVIVEASERSGARVQARLALAHGRPVFLMRGVLENGWARELADRPGVQVVETSQQVTDTIERLDATDPLVE